MTAVDPSQPYNSLPLLPPPREMIENVSTLRHAIAANRRLAELNSACKLIPNPGMLLRSLLLQEAKLSSEIENIFTTNDRLYRSISQSAQQIDPHTKEVLSYNEALWFGFEEIRRGRPLSSSLFQDLFRIIKKTDDGIRKTEGCVIVSDKTGQVVYTPPAGENIIRHLLDNLGSYLHEPSDIDSLIRMAVAHYQFEAIHPFPDGNGRTGRILNVLYLVENGLLDQPVLYLSRFIIENKADYYQGMRSVTFQDDWSGWICYMLKAIEETASITTQKIHAIRNAIDLATQRAKAAMGQRFSAELIELIFANPYTRISSLAEAGIAKRQTASTYLRELEEIGLLQSQRFGRDVLYVNTDLMELLSR